MTASNRKEPVFALNIELGALRVRAVKGYQARHNASVTQAVSDLIDFGAMVDIALSDGLKVEIVNEQTGQVTVLTRRDSPEALEAAFNGRELGTRSTNNFIAKITRWLKRAQRP